jgi:methylated-DNA-[protein]-cysteine S-methyltransferase
VAGLETAPAERHITMMATPGYTLFDTTIGACGIAWSERGVVTVRLLAANSGAMRASLLKRCPGASEMPPPPEVQRAIDRIVALLQGEAADLTFVTLDMANVGVFERRLYDTLRAIPPGETVTYGELAARLGEGDARDVGQAMGHNPFPIIVPCHRVVAAGGKTGGFSAPGGVNTKLRMLAIESVHMKGTLFDLGRGAKR